MYSDLRRTLCLEPSNTFDDLIASQRDAEFAFAAFDEFQKPVAEIERLTDLQFGNLRDHDPFTEARDTENLGGAGSRLTGFQDITI